MAWKKEKQKSAVKGKRSAFLITVIVHVLIFVATGYFVAMEVIEHKEAKFTARQVKRPKMALQKLRMPVKMEQKVKRTPPKLSQRVTVNDRLNTKAAEFKMPEISGFGSGLGDLTAATLSAGSLGFANMQVNVFGAKSRGEKFLFLLNTESHMMKDEVGGIPAYRVIKNELSQLIDSLPSTALFNIVLFDNFEARSLFYNLSPASAENRKKLVEWLRPLNESKEIWGFDSLEEDGFVLIPESCEPIAFSEKDRCGLLASLGYSVRQGADAVFWLGGNQWILSTTEDRYKAYKRGDSLEDLPEAQGGLNIEDYGVERWEELLGKAKAMKKAEDKERLKNGMAVRVLDGKLGLVKAYFPNEKMPEHYNKTSSDAYSYTADDILDYMENMAEKYQEIASTKMRFNGIYFIPKVLNENEKQPPNVDIIRMITRKYRGAFQELQGLDAIQSASSY